MPKGKALVFPATVKGTEAFTAIVRRTPQRDFAKRRRAFIGRFEDAIIGNAELTGNEKVTALAIVRHMYASTNICWASFETLANFCCTSKRSIIRHEKKLIANGWFAKLRGDGSRIDRPGYGRYRFTNHYCINPDMVPEESVHRTKQLQRKGVSESSPLDADGDNPDAPKATTSANGDFGVTIRAGGVTELTTPSDRAVTQTFLRNPPESKPSVRRASRKSMTFGGNKNQLGLIRSEIRDGTVDAVTAAAEVRSMMDWAHDSIRDDMARRDFLSECTRAYFDLDALQTHGD